jgi:hypothetical protein
MMQNDNGLPVSTAMDDWQEEKRGTPHGHLHLKKAMG